MTTARAKAPGKTDRNNPKVARSSDATTSIFEFDRMYPDDAACLTKLVEMLYPDGIHCPKCGKVTKHYRIKARPAYSCEFCGHMEYPMKGTIFEGSSTSLRLWFYAMYLMASTRCGISAKQLEREVGVSYPTAHRMFKQIRSLLDQGDPMLRGTVEVDEGYFGGAGKWKHHSKGKAYKRGTGDKSMVLGFAERETGRISATVQPRGGAGIKDKVAERVLPASAVFTDESILYWDLDKVGYSHQRVNHQQKVYVSGAVHTNTIEGFWSLVKRGISGTYHAVSTEYLQTYLDEYVFRYNHRDDPAGMFNAFLGRVQKSPS